MEVGGSFGSKGIDKEEYPPTNMPRKIRISSIEPFDICGGAICMQEINPVAAGGNNRAREIESLDKTRSSVHPRGDWERLEPTRSDTTKRKEATKKRNKTRVRGRTKWTSFLSWRWMPKENSKKSRNTRPKILRDQNTPYNTIHLYVHGFWDMLQVMNFFGWIVIEW